MKVLSSLRSRIFLTSALLAVLSIGVAVYLISITVTREAEDALRREIEATGAVVEQLRTTRAQTYTMMARLIADTPKLRAAVDTDDPATVQPQLEDIASLNQLNTHLLLVTNRAGKVLSTVGVDARAGLVMGYQPSISDAIAGHESFSLLPQPKGLLQLVVVPIRVGARQADIKGTLSVGFLLDEAFAGQLKEITGSEIAFLMDGQVLAATLPPPDRPALGPLTRTVEGTRNVTLGSEEFVALPLPLSSGLHADIPGGGPVALILRSRTEHLRFLRTIHTELAVTALVAMLLAGLLSFTVARTITRPLADITSVMREVSATGDLTRKIVLRADGRWDDEDARLLATTFNTLTESIARFQREITQRERLSSLGRLSTVIAHEVRNPLMIIKAALHSLRQPDVPGAVLREAAADIDEEVGRLNRMVNEVLDFARPIRYELSSADLNALCRECATAAQAAPGAAVELDLEASLPPIRTDAERLRIALVNLIVNARQAVEPQELAVAVGAETRAVRTGPVSLSTRQVAEGVRIVVADNGRGIKGSDLSRVFDPYYTTKRGGTGLGLPIAKNIIEGLGGAITIESRPGRGTEMRIDLPLQAPVGTDPGPEQAR
jgi:signal transduction histidine kinase